MACACFCAPPNAALPPPSLLPLTKVATRQRCVPAAAASQVQGSYLAGLTAAYFGQLLDLTQLVQVGCWLELVGAASVYSWPCRDGCVCWRHHHLLACDHCLPVTAAGWVAATALCQRLTLLPIHCVSTQQVVILTAFLLTVDQVANAGGFEALLVDTGAQCMLGCLQAGRSWWRSPVEVQAVAHSLVVPTVT